MKVSKSLGTGGRILKVKTDFSNVDNFLLAVLMLLLFYANECVKKNKKNKVPCTERKKQQQSGLTKSCHVTK